MTKQEQKEYLQKFVASQGTQAGLSITPLLEAIINGNDDIFVVTVEDNAENTKKVTNPQDEINGLIFVDGGKYILTLSTTEESSQLVYTANEP